MYFNQNQSIKFLTNSVQLTKRDNMDYINSDRAYFVGIYLVKVKNGSENSSSIILLIRL